MRKKITCKIIGCLLLAACVKPYEPKVIQASNNYLVIDGIINCAPAGQTTIALTRTRKLSDTVTAIPEENAHIIIEGQGGDQFPLREDSNGVYSSLPLTLNTTGRYRLLIRTQDGTDYASDFVPVTVTPPIDSLNWKQSENDITVYVTTHDPQNNTRYYRWEYAETWDYNTPVEATLKFVNNEIVFRTDAELTKHCWRYAISTDIVQQSTAQLSQDVVQQAPVAVVSSQSQRFESKYSINVRQFALTKEAYEYWQILKRNTQQLGSIFDAQPSQLVGNLHNLTKENEPVIGYITAATVQEKRLFIRRAEVVNPYTPMSDCKSLVILKDSAGFYLANPLYRAAHYVGNGGYYIAITTPDCIDCRLAGGTTKRPSFWQ